MKLCYILFFALLLPQDQIPFKSNDEFELKLQLEFKKRPMQDMNTIELERRSVPSTGGMPAPYLHINLKVLKVISEEVRVKVTKNPDDILLFRKFNPNEIIKLDLGFTDDIKDRATSHHFIVTYLSKEKKPLSKIEIFFEEDGSYLVNGEKRGKF
jgi:hypothetical protein